MAAPIGCGHEAMQAAGLIEANKGGHDPNHTLSLKGQLVEHLLETNRRKRSL